MIHYELSKVDSIFFGKSTQTEVKTHEVFKKKFWVVAPETLQMLKNSALEHVQNRGVVLGFEKLVPSLGLDVV